MNTVNKAKQRLTKIAHIICDCDVNKSWRARYVIENRNYVTITVRRHSVMLTKHSRCPSAKNWRTQQTDTVSLHAAVSTFSQSNQKSEGNSSIVDLHGMTSFSYLFTRPRICASSHMLKLVRELCSYTYPPLSIARYSFIQLSELEQCTVIKLAQGFTPQPGFEPGFS